MATENLFVDTSIFVQENFPEGTRINTILNLSADGHLQLFLSEITINEIKARFKKQATLAFDKHNEFINDKARISQVHVLRNNPESKNIIKRLPTLKTIFEDFNIQLDNQLKSAGANILLYPIIDIGEVFNNYFSNKHPFSSEDKKHEFPDAFAFAHIEQWCADNKCTALFLTKDKDFSPKANTYIEVINDHEKFIDDKMKAVIEEKRLHKLKELFLYNSDRIDKEITTWVEEQLGYDGIFDDFTNWLEINE